MSTGPASSGHPSASLVHLAPAQQQAALSAELLGRHAELLLDAVLAEPASVARAMVLRRRASVWKTVSQRVPVIPVDRWPERALQLLADGSGTRAVGRDYAEMLEMFATRLGIAHNQLPAPRRLGSTVPRHETP